MALFEVKDVDRRIYEQELKDFLPDKIFDAHVHVYLAALKEPPKDGKPRTVRWPGMVAKEDSIEDLQETYRLMFPDKKCEALMFTSGGASAANNRYVAEASKKTGFPALYYSHPEETPDEIEQRIREGHFLGLKGYLSFAPKYIPGDEVRIFDFFPPYQLERLNEMGGILMVHIPRSGRLKDRVNLAQLIEIYKKYPNIKMIVAHIGRAYTKGDVADAFEILKEAPGMVFDFSANCNEYAITKCLEFGGPRQLLFGSDLPILRMRTRRITENGTYINLVPKGLYGDVSIDPHMRELEGVEADALTFFMYEELLAFKRACQTLGLTKQDVEDVMYNNTKSIVDAAKRSIYGE